MTTYVPFFPGTWRTLLIKYILHLYQFYVLCFFSQVSFTEENMTSFQNGSLLSYHSVIFYTIHTTYLFVVFITDRFRAPVTSFAATMFLNIVTVDHLGFLLNADSDSVCLG